MTRISIDIPSHQDKQIIIAVLEAFKSKQMLDFKEIKELDNDSEDNLPIPQISVNELNAIIEKAEAGIDIPFEKFLEKHGQ